MGETGQDPLFLLLVLTAVAVTLHTLVASGSLANERRRDAARKFAGIHVALFLLGPCAATLPEPFVWDAVSCGLIVSSLVPTIYVRLSVLGESEPVPLRADSTRRMDLFVSRFGISRREREIVSLILAGKTNFEIGEILFISPNTVRNHVYNVYRKAEVRNRVELTNLILEQC